MRRALPCAVALVAMLTVPAAWPALAGPLAGPSERAGALPLGILLPSGQEDVLRPSGVFPPRFPGTVVRTTLEYGPHFIPPGWDLNRLLLDVQIGVGFITKLGYRLVDAATGEEPTNMEVHVHHAIWTRGPGPDTNELVFGTGEERTTLDFDARSDAQPGGPRYGIRLKSWDANVLVLMLHNKEASSRTARLLLDVTFVHGTPEQIRDAQGCPEVPVLPADGCAAGLDFHELDGHLWGDIFHVPRDAQGPGTYLHPRPGQPYVQYTAPAHGTMVSAAGHVHQNGIATIVVNLGPPGSTCEADLDGDGIPGTTLLRSEKIDRRPEAGYASEDAQMGISQPGWRAPIRTGDRIALYGLYRNDLHASYQAMTFLLAHVDEAQPPGPYAAGVCQLQDVAPYLVQGEGDPTRTIPSRPWTGPALPLCGVPGEFACDRPVGAMPLGQGTPVVAIAGFTYMPGDQHLTGSLGAPVRVPEGQGLTFVNLDTAGVIKHSVTSCPWPCNGPYVANYPQPDGLFESGSLGNLDRYDQGSIPPDEGDDPLWTTPTDLAAGLYAYYCRLHPSMRGSFEVV